MNENDINHVYICKIDTEGLDNLVIRGLHEYLSESIKYFVTEYENKISYEKVKNSIY